MLKQTNFDNSRSSVPRISKKYLTDTEIRLGTSNHNSIYM